VKRTDVTSLLRRELLGKLGNVDLAELDRAALVGPHHRARGRRAPWSGQDLRSKAAVLLGWATNEGLISGSPLAGWRRERRTRAERLEQPGRALSDDELPVPHNLKFWQRSP
jgi:hypothetical protein